MGACCRMGVPARTGVSPRVRQLAPKPIVSSPPFDPPMGMGVTCSLVIFQSRGIPEILELSSSELRLLVYSGG
eukprot:2996600-Pyramimonas_sp.AAC.1